jgi:uncharacterized protein YggE
MTFCVILRCGSFMERVKRSAFPHAMAVAFAMLSCCAVQAQIAGNSVYGQSNGKAKAEQNQKSLRELTPQDLPPTGSSTLVDANVLMNVKADEFVAVFGVAGEGATVAEVSQKVDETIRQFTDALKAMHIRESEIFVDYIADPKIYGYEMSNNSAQERLTGFEMEKNVSVHYSDRALIDKLVAAAANAQIYDLIKVDYIVKDIDQVQSTLMEEASAIIKQKVTQYEKLLGIKLEAPAQVYIERPAIYYPTDMYDSYTAAESESLSVPPSLQRYTVQRTRHIRTFYFNGLDGNGFDKVINPVVLEPVVQFTLYLKVKYEVAR